MCSLKLDKVNNKTEYNYITVQNLTPRIASIIMLCVANMPNMQNVTMLVVEIKSSMQSVVMLSIAKKFIVLSIILLSVTNTPI